MLHIIKLRSLTTRTRTKKHTAVSEQMQITSVDSVPLRITSNVISWLFISRMQLADQLLLLLLLRTSLVSPKNKGNSLSYRAAAREIETDQSMTGLVEVRSSVLKLAMITTDENAWNLSWLVRGGQPVSLFVDLAYESELVRQQTALPSTVSGLHLHNSFWCSLEYGCGRVVVVQLVDRDASRFAYSFAWLASIRGRSVPGIWFHGCTPLTLPCNRPEGDRSKAGCFISAKHSI